MIERRDGGEFQLEKRRLRGIGVYADEALGPLQKEAQCVAAGARNGQYRVVLAHRKTEAVDLRVFPIHSEYDSAKNRALEVRTAPPSHVGAKIQLAVPAVRLAHFRPETTWSTRAIPSRSPLRGRAPPWRRRRYDPPQCGWNKAIGT